MAEYNAWNQSILEYFTSSIPKGRPVFLSLNDSKVIDIGINYIGLDENDCINDFEQAIREEFTIGETVYINTNQILNQDSPEYVGLLSAMVLASHRMIDDEEASEMAYFRRLSKLLINDDIDGRPPGLATGDEDILWNHWNEYLSKNGWIKTAKKGLGAWKYTALPISQSLLRDGDLIYLLKLFQQNFSAKKISKNLDENGLKSWILNHWREIKRKHLLDGFLSEDIVRSSEFYSCVFDLYENIDWDNLHADQQSFTKKVSIPKNIKCGLLRNIDEDSERVSYKILPRKPRGYKEVMTCFQDENGNQKKLKPSIRGFYEEIGEVDPFFAEDIEYEILNSNLEKIILRSKEFWVLTKNSMDSGNRFGTWHDFDDSLGTKMLILINGKEGILHDEMLMFKEQGLINWNGDPIICEGRNGSKWTEYHQCMVLKNCWDGVIPHPEAQDLFNRIKPGLLQFSSINLIGGLMIPEQNAWIIDHPPKIKLYGFEERFKAEISSESEILGTKTLETQFEYDLIELAHKKLDAGHYKIRVSSGEYLDEAIFNLIKWSDLTISNSITGELEDPIKEIKNA